jgi:hypothetical protein
MEQIIGRKILDLTRIPNGTFLIMAPAKLKCAKKLFIWGKGNNLKVVWDSFSTLS